jgi:N-methylhydantoinase A/oxoprolinase/acetone carboxylase beta subunit
LIIEKLAVALGMVLSEFLGLDHEKLSPGHRVEGPAIIEQMGATTLVLPGQTAMVDAYLNVLLQG